MARGALLWSYSLSILAALRLVSADIEFTSPAAGAKLTGGSAVTVEWKDSGTAPAISALTTYQLFLCAGGNSEDTLDVLYTLTAATPSTFSVTGNTFSATLGTALGGTTTNAYFFKMISTASAGGTVTNYSPRFSLSGMTGSFSTKVIAALKDVTGTDSPPAINAVANANNAASGASGDYGVAYTMQTGPIRYAPMQPVPPTKITKKTASPLYPTSSVSVATGVLPNPSQQTTITQSQTFSVSSMENTVAAAAMPSDDMQKFLNRWKD